MRTSSFAIGLACFALSYAAALPAHAQTRCAPIAGGGPALEAVDAKARLAFVRSVMRDQGIRAERWRWGWTGVGFALAVGQYGLTPFYPQDKRIAELFSATASLYLPLSLAIVPLKIKRYSDLLEHAAKEIEGGASDTMTCLVLDRGEEQLILAAHDEAQLTSPLLQVVDLVLTAGYATIFAFGFKDVGETLLNGIGALVLTETQFFSTPRGAIRALARYRQGDISGAPSGSPPPFFSWSVAPLPNAPGLSVVARF